MKLLKSDHYTITRLLLQDSDGKIYELFEDSLGSYYFWDWEGDADGSIDGMNWKEYSRSDYENLSVFGSGDRVKHLEP
ncbi:MAG: hypothetical protein FVQ80_13825 [Planctomycetes bacterium]|nr:hypothetical protein [Planctomycetota bacterium]